MTDSAAQSAGLKIVADENIPALEEYFGDLGTLQRYHGRTLTRDQLIDADILLVRSVTQVNQSLLEGTRVRFVGSCTIGTDHLDTHWLERNDIFWSAAPGCNANSVVEYVFCTLAALAVDWRSRSFGIVGCGNVGGLLHKRLQALGISCAVYDPWLEDNPDASGLDQVLCQDIVCLHAPLVKGGSYPSFHMIGEEQLQRLRDDTVLISAGRGGVVDNRALLVEIQRGKRFTTVLDVWENEPDIDIDLLQAVDLGTPHIAGYSLDGKLAGTRMIREALCRQLGIAPLAVEDKSTGSIVEIVGDSAAELLLQMYDPREDDRRLRAAAAGTAPMQAAFDQLRKDYPERLEFSHYRTFIQVLEERQKQQLAVLGLACN
ncbi:4-phosphoerythronate dehydrogenase [Microbulbifer sp. OS29]|uniref:Erythronate-4-phosphate dehydrogenase n=1 Tax=Microbulbifer okhotskensis TaxID=2926617 RepID=A0A9X2J564_9GAMM|nr:4-phosphoerythronate dehydrogenase [Microbulbifer okhotskensis]MCO1335262.1 4-phosphoerythronate dehydrogenase [Microbulbifer okhotskensis]